MVTTVLSIYGWRTLVIRFDMFLTCQEIKNDLISHCVLLGDDIGYPLPSGGCPSVSSNCKWMSLELDWTVLVCLCVSTFTNPLINRAAANKSWG